MKNEGLEKASGYMKKHRLRKRWQKVVTCLAAVVVFCTTYALILPAITLEKDSVLNCSFEVHQHAISCFDANGNIICGYADYAVHTHNADCYDSEGNLVCPLNEVEPHEHNDSCYEEQTVLVCSQKESDGHRHESSCYEKQAALVCGQTENDGHQHDESCYTLVRGNLTCADVSEPHEHTDDCYEWTKKLTCGMEAGEGAHHHSEACYKETSEPICGLEEGEDAHHHGDDCYETQSVLTCKKPEVILHTHSDDCYEDILDESGKVIGRELICGKLQVLEHIHDEGCFINAGSDEEEGNAEATETLAPSPEAQTAAIAGEKEFTYENDQVMISFKLEGSVNLPVETEAGEQIQAEGDAPAEDTTPAGEAVPVKDEAEPEETFWDDIDVQTVQLEESDEIYQQLTAFAQEQNSTDEILSLLAVQSQFSYQGTELDVSDCTLNATITPKEASADADVETLGDGTASETNPGVVLSVLQEDEDTITELDSVLVTADTETTQTLTVLLDADSVMALYATQANLSYTLGYPVDEPSNLSRYAGYKYISDDYYKMSHVMLCASVGSSGDYTGPLVLIPLDSDWPWSPDPVPWDPSGSNYRVAYCCAWGVDTARTIDAYTEEPLLTANWQSESTRIRLGRIIRHAYPFISAEEVLAEMKAAGYDTSDIGISEIMAGAQYAIWLDTGLAGTVSITTTTSSTSSGNFTQINPLTSGEIGSTSGTVSDAVTRVKDYFQSLGDDGAVYSALDIEGLAFSSLKRAEDGTYNVTLTVSLNRAVSATDTDLNLTVSYGETEKEITLTVGQTEAVVNLTGFTPEDTVTAELSGTTKNVWDLWLYMGYDMDQNPPAEGTAQNMVGGTRKDVSFQAKKQLSFPGDVTSVTVKKEWSGTTGTEVSVSLIANGETQETVSLSESNGWSYTWENLLTVDENGSGIEYTVEETPIPGYAVSIAASTEDVEGKHVTTFQITNTEVSAGEKTDIRVKKEWADGEDQHTVDEITVRLLANGTDTGNSLALNSQNGWQGEFSGLSRLDESGYVIDYTVVEDPVEGYEAEYTLTTSKGGVAWEQVTELENGGIYRFVSSDGKALSMRGGGGVEEQYVAVEDSDEDEERQQWKATASGDGFLLSNAVLINGKEMYLRGGSSGNFASIFTYSDRNIYIFQLNDNRLYCTGTNAYLYFTGTDGLSNQVGCGNKKNATVFTVYKKVSAPETLNVTITNSPKKYGPLLPETGGTGTIPYTIGGLLLLTGAGTLLLYKRRKRRKEGFASL